MSKSLYHISEEYIQLMERIEDAEGVLDESTALALEINSEEVQVKGGNYGLMIRKYEGDIAAIDAEIKRLTALKKSKVSTVGRLKESISNAMQLFGITKIETPIIKLSFRKSTRLVETDDYNLTNLPEKYLTREEVVKVDKKAITADLKAGESVVGYELQDNQNLQIK